MANSKPKKKRLVKGSPEALAWGKKLAEARKAKKAGATVTSNSGTVTTCNSGTITGSDTTFETPESELKRLTEELQDGMPTKNDMKTTPPGAVGRHLKWVNRNIERTARWKELRRQLYPNDYNAANLENIRKE